MLARHFFHMAANNAWANLRLLNACVELGDGEFNAHRRSFFGSIAATANHNLTVDWFYVDAVERWAEGRPVNNNSASYFEEECPFASAMPLRAAQRDVDLRLLNVCRGLEDQRLVEAVPIQRARGIVKEAVPRYLAHLFQHQIHHRGQIHGLLSTTAVAPPQLDEFYGTGDAEVRHDELLALGTSETILWG